MGFKMLTATGSDPAENSWLWYTPESEEPYVFDVGEVVRFRVEAEEWNDQRPTGPDRAEAQTASEIKPPYRIRVSYVFCLLLPLIIEELLLTFRKASMALSGLGQLQWWGGY